MSIGLTTYRVHDASLGSWWQVDPKAEANFMLSPYNSMNNNPISMSDPDGDLAFLAAVGIGAAVGVFGNGLSNASQGQGFFDGAGKAALWGGIGAAASFGIGSAAGGLFGNGSSFGKAAFQFGAHGVSNGLQSHLQGGSFGQGFLSGGIGSGLSSGIHALGGGAGGQIFGGGLGGGIGSAISGGNFFEGFGQGIAVGAFNHALHSGFSGGPGDPPSKKQVKAYLAGEYLDGVISRQEYMNAITLVDDGSWGLVKQVLYNNKTDIALTVGGGGFLKILSKTRFIKNGALFGSNNFRIQFGKEFGSYFPGRVKGGIQGGARAWHINFGKTHIYLNPMQWGKMTSAWYKPWK